MKFCPECGCKLDDDMMFCGECGTRQIVEEVVPAPVVEAVIPEPVVEEVIPEPVVEEVIPEPVVEEVIPEPVVEAVVPAAAGNVCPQCGFENADGDVFCMECGCNMAAPVELKLYCPACGQENAEGDMFCMKCGQSLAGVAMSAKPPVIEKNDFEAKAKDAAEKAGKMAKKGAKEAVKFAKKAASSAKKAADKAGKEAKKAAGKAKGVKLPKAAIFGGAAVAAVAVVLVILAICGVFSGSSGSGAEYALYVKDSEIFYTDFGKDEPLQVTDRLADDVSNEELADSAYIISDYTALVKGDGRMFYPDRIDDGEEGVTIYYRDLGKKKDAEKLDSEIISYAVNEKGNQVIYLKGDDGKLYRSDLKDKEKLASEVVDFYVTEDLQKVMYRTDDGDLYIKAGKGDKEKVASDVAEIYYVAEDLQSLYYRKDTDLYMQKIGADKEKLADDVNSVVWVYESGEMYFTTAEEEKVDFAKFIRDDLAASDAAMVEPGYVEYPEYPSRPRSYNYDSDEEYEQAYAEYEQACADYEQICADLNAENEAAWEAYYAKQNRDSIREEMKGQENTRQVYTLHYFDGKETVQVAEDVTSSWVRANAFDVPVVAFDVYGDVSGVKLDITEISGVWEVSDALDSARNEGQTTYICESTACSPMDEAYNLMAITDDGKEVLLMGDINEKKQEGNLYTASVKGGIMGEPELLDEDVYAYYGNYQPNGEPAYFKDVSERTYEGDLYLDGKEVDYDVYVFSLEYVEAMDALLYATDTKQGAEGTLKILKGKKAEIVGEDIHTYQITGSGKLYYLADYSERKCAGEMYVYGQKNGLMDEDVVALMWPAHGAGEVCGGSYYW